MVDEISIVPMKDKHFRMLAESYMAFSSSVFHSLGLDFIETFFKLLCQDTTCTCSFSAINSKEKVVGVIVGTLHRSRDYRKVLRKHPLQLIRSIGWRLFRIRTFLWILYGFAERMKQITKKKVMPPASLPDAELLFISLHPDAQGKGLGHALVNTMEIWFAQRNHIHEYLIITEVDNVYANRFYAKRGAQKVFQQKRRDLHLNYYVQKIRHTNEQ